MEQLIERGRRERIVLVGVASGTTTLDDAEESLDELALLIDTAGADEVGRLLQRRDTPDPATYLGTGKVAELKELSEFTDCDTVVFDDELTPAQSRNLERLLGRTAIDRTAVILDIFDSHARSAEAKAQVELALLRYRLPRLRGKTTGLAQQSGGIGTRTRGKGETQLEVDRRRLTQRIHRLEADLRHQGSVRATQRKARLATELPRVAIVGYTNAGKSTLLNALTNAGVVAEDRLFATVDPTTRKLQLPGGESILLSDTVGFVRKLPHQLVKAFRTTLDEVIHADLLIHVVDGSGANPAANVTAVREVLSELGADNVAEMLVVNKADRGPAAAEFAARSPGAVLVSAHTGLGLDALVRELAVRVRANSRHVELLVPFDRGEVLAALFRSGKVSHQEPGPDGIKVAALLDLASIRRWSSFVVSGADDLLGQSPGEDTGDPARTIVSATASATDADLVAPLPGE